jgi:CRISPR-associated endonuclease/helicase Cas3
MSLTANHFPEFYSAVNGYEPFPWQRELVKTLVEHQGRWPAVLDLPTSAGKTSALDAAVFLLALQVVESEGSFTPIPVCERTAGLRTFFVVDRRIVVDEAGEKAKKLANVLNTADDRPDAVSRLQASIRELRRLAPDAEGPLTPSEVATIQAVSKRLRAFGGDKALHVSVLRGGMYRDGSWAETPNQPTICLSTVDQVGSRLLFRGYGVSPYQRAVHAGLVGNDALILVDEAHLSRPFIESLKAVEFYRSERWAERPVKTPFQVVVMSATAGRAAEPVGPMCEEESLRPAKIALKPETDKNPEVCLELVRRLNAKKVATLAEASSEQFISTIVEHALSLSRAEDGAKPANVVGVVVNRVRSARAVADLLLRRYREECPLAEGESDADALDVVLLTGRVRPYDRDELLFRKSIPVPGGADVLQRGLLPFVKAAANAERTDYGRPAPPRGKLFVVATQTVEVGADFSFDALVTEVAPLDALRQRFGRVDRLGFRGLSRAVIVRNKDADKTDPVYGTAPTEVWKQLQLWMKAAKKRSRTRAKGTDRSRRQRAEGDATSKLVGVDFGIEEMDNLLAAVADPAPLFTRPETAPVMMPAHMDEWVQTSIAPVPDPNPEVFLHGPASGPPDVSVVWRADITEETLRSTTTARRIVALVPPVSMEALPVPVWQARAWLLAVAERLNAGKQREADEPQDFTDLEGESEPEEGRRRVARRCARFIRWRGPETDDGTVVSDDPADICPGDTIVVPSLYGGSDCFGWNPDLADAVTDVADDCSWRARRRPLLRVHLPTGLHRIALAAWGVPSAESGQAIADELARAARPESEGGELEPRRVLAALRSIDGLPQELASAVHGRGRAIPYPDESGIVIRLAVQPPSREADHEQEAPADDEGNSFIGAGDLVPLDRHCAQVRRRVEHFATSLGLSSEIATALCRAADLHDAGKADPRFQLWLYGSEVVAARNGYTLVAKSSAEEQNAAFIEAARRRAGWPQGGRHEALSVLMVRGNPEAVAGVADPELLIHLLGTHHGRGRPLWPVPPEDDVPGSLATPPAVARCRLLDLDLSVKPESRPESSLTTLHAGWVDSFWRMVTRYGWWGLAYLEAILMLADHRQSQAEREAAS